MEAPQPPKSTNRAENGEIEVLRDDEKVRITRYCDGTVRKDFKLGAMKIIAGKDASPENAQGGLAIQ